MGWPGRSALRSSERCAWADTHRSTSSAPATHGSTSVARADSAATWDVALVPASMCMVRQTPPGPSRQTPSWTARAGTRDGVTEPSTWTEVLSAAATVQVHISLLPPHIGQDEGIRPWSHRSEPGRSKSLAMERRHSLPRGHRPQICVGGRGGPVLKPSLRQSRKDMSYSCTMPGKTASNGGAASRNVATPTVPGASRPGSRPAPPFNEGPTSPGSSELRALAAGGWSGTVPGLVIRRTPQPSQLYIEWGHRRHQGG